MQMHVRPDVDNIRATGHSAETLVPIISPEGAVPDDFFS
jgi:hypothetical protein